MTACEPANSGAIVTMATPPAGVQSLIRSRLGGRIKPGIVDAGPLG